VSSKFQLRDYESVELPTLVYLFFEPNSGQWTLYQPRDTLGINGLALDNVRDMIIDSEGGYWFATARGIRRLKENYWTNYGQGDGLPNLTAMGLGVGFGRSTAAMRAIF
jgi:ligand-binding sensor domain-containing protein